MKTIAFKQKDFEEGLKTIVASGTVVWTDKAPVYHVPDESVKVLQQKRIPFQVVTFADGKSTKS
jgi:hypothetical protein